MAPTSCYKKFVLCVLLEELMVQPNFSSLAVCAHDSEVHGIGLDSQSMSLHVVVSKVQKSPTFSSSDPVDITVAMVPVSDDIYNPVRRLVHKAPPKRFSNILEIHFSSNSCGVTVNHINNGRWCFVQLPLMLIARERPN